MKKLKITFICLFFAMISCVPVKKETEKKETEKKETEKEKIWREHSIQEISFDGCQYILFHSYKSGGLTHKGNCNNHDLMNKKQDLPKLK
jgi:protein involved in sex pheromone biosynthesis